MKKCSCGREVRLRAIKMRVNRKHGITHWIEHVDGTRVCIDGQWHSYMEKPYPKRDEEKPHRQMVQRWEQAADAAKDVNRAIERADHALAKVGK